MSGCNTINPGKQQTLIDGPSQSFAKEDAMRLRATFMSLTLMVTTACVPVTSPGTPAQPATDLPEPTIEVATATTAPTATLAEAATATAAPTATLAATATTAAATATATTSGSATQTSPGADVYYDDRSDARTFVLSYVNALARHEPLRAHGYWRDSADRPAFADIEQEFMDLTGASVEVGEILADAGAGQRYFAVPALVTLNRDAGNEVEADCFYLHLASPDLQAEPPFRPLGLERLTRQPLTESSNAANALATACPADAGGPMNPLPTFDPADISAERYLDDRSDATQILRSLFNAVNRQEFARAYSYWDPSSPEIKPFDVFAAGYADTTKVSIEFGDVIGDAGAGQYYYQAPVILRSETGAGVKQVYVGCYTMHISNPSIQATPPFEPLAITAGTATAVSEAEAQTRLQTACTP